MTAGERVGKISTKVAWEHQGKKKKKNSEGAHPPGKREIHF